MRPDQPAPAPSPSSGDSARRPPTPHPARTSPPGPAGSGPYVALATCRAYPALDDEGAALRETLSALGVRVEVALWDEPRDWAAYDAVVIRSTWDYTERLADYLAWTRLPRRLLNAPQVVAWNADKRYLAELAEAAIPTVPTRYLAPHEVRAEAAASGGPLGAALALDGAVGGHGEIVVKPTVSASSQDTGRFDRRNPDASRLAGRIAASGRHVMVQPYLDRVDADGEASLVYLGGTYSHAARKEALLQPAGVTGDGYHPDVSPSEPSEQERAVGDAVMDYLADRFGPLTYARIDLLPGPEGPAVLEAELIEPSLWLENPDLLERFAHTIVAAAHP